MSMIEVKGPDGRIFVFPPDTPQEVIDNTLAQNYNNNQNNNYNNPYENYNNSGVANNPPTNQGFFDKSRYLEIGVALLAIIIFGLWSFGAFDKRKTLPVNNAGNAVVAPANQIDANYQPLATEEVQTAKVATQIRAEPKSDAAVLKEIAQGITVNVVGEETLADAKWEKVRMDDGSFGWVNSAHLEVLNNSDNAAANAASAAADAAASAANAASRAVAQASQASAPIRIMPTIYYVASSAINVRREPSPSSSIAGKIPFNSKVLAVAKVIIPNASDWVEVESEYGISGWVNSSLLSQAPLTTMIDAPQDAPVGRVESQESYTPPSTPSSSSSSSNIIITAINANVRSSPRVSPENVIDVAPNGDVLDVEKTTYSNGKKWYLVSTSKGIVGWVSGDAAQPYDDE